MSRPGFPIQPNLRRKVLTNGIAAVFVLASPIACATSFVVNCNDSGGGSLRAAISNAAENDIVDMTGLTTASPGCSSSTISLSSGSIPASRNSLTINGSKKTSILVTGAYANGSSSAKGPNRLLRHYGTGTLTINDLSFGNGYANGPGPNSRGGCIYSKGIVKLNHVEMSFCKVHTTDTISMGGAIYSSNGVYLSDSTLLFNTAQGVTSSESRGGAVYTYGNFSSTNSALKNNLAGKTGGSNGYGGAVFARGPVSTLNNTTISGNIAGNAGAFAAIPLLGVENATISESTISGNTSMGLGSGVTIFADVVTIANSTIAFNSGPTGLYLLGMGTSASANLSSTIISNNTYISSGTPNDLVASGIQITGSNNLIFAPSASVPSDTLVGKCPLLAPLAGNGVSIQTHALRGHSPAIDMGINPNGDTYDERGPPYIRTSGSPGTTPFPDIGAYEVNRVDEIFDVDFEGCT